ncbi:unnamed protein product [Amoebophrya sp. A120]|nr:unnamed protein product [Amoebophrya sp. A120]|eukprot:GSA120T00002467001.1
MIRRSSATSDSHSHSNEDAVFLRSTDEQSLAATAENDKTLGAARNDPRTSNRENPRPPLDLEPRIKREDLSTSSLYLDRFRVTSRELLPVTVQLDEEHTKASADTNGTCKTTDKERANSSKNNAVIVTDLLQERQRSDQNSVLVVVLTSEQGWTSAAAANSLVYLLALAYQFPQGFVVLALPQHVTGSSQLLAAPGAEQMKDTTDNRLLVAIAKKCALKMRPEGAIMQQRDLVIEEPPAPELCPTNVYFAVDVDTAADMKKLIPLEPASPIKKDADVAKSTPANKDIAEATRLAQGVIDHLTTLFDTNKSRTNMLTEKSHESQLQNHSAQSGNTAPREQSADDSKHSEKRATRSLEFFLRLNELNAWLPRTIVVNNNFSGPAAGPKMTNVTPHTTPPRDYILVMPQMNDQLFYEKEKLKRTNNSILPPTNRCDKETNRANHSDEDEKSPATRPVEKIVHTDAKSMQLFPRFVGIFTNEENPQLPLGSLIPC